MKTISITEEAYERLKSLKNDKTTSFSEVIVTYYPVRRKLSDVLDELGDCTDLAESIDNVSRGGCGKHKLIKVPCPAVPRRGHHGGEPPHILSIFIIGARNELNQIHFYRAMECVSI